MKQIKLNYWSPRKEVVITESGFTYEDKKSVITSTKEITAETEIKLFEQFYQLNNNLRYCNGSFYTFHDDKSQEEYNTWLKSDDFNKKSFNLFYGNGVVD